MGAPRAGTTSLWTYLGQHPEIFMSKVKEPAFFSPKSYPSDAVAEEDAYLRLFARAGSARYRGEATPAYLNDEGVPEAIARVSPGARIVISLREPVARAYSSYWHAVRDGRERRPFREVIEESLAGAGPPHSFIGRGLYAEGVERYLRTFPGAVHILFYDELAADTRGEVRRIFEFLGVDAHYADRFRADVRNPSFQPRNALVRHLYASPLVRKVGRGLVPGRLHGRAEATLLARGRKQPLDPDVRARLEAVFAHDRERLESVLDRPVPWSPA